MTKRPYVRIVFTLLFTIIAGGCALLVGMQLNEQLNMLQQGARQVTGACWQLHRTVI